MIKYQSRYDFVDDHGSMGGRRKRVLDNWYYPFPMDSGFGLQYTVRDITAVAVSMRRPVDYNVLAEVARSAHGMDVTADDIRMHEVHRM